MGTAISLMYTSRPINQWIMMGRLIHWLIGQGPCEVSATFRKAACCSRSRCGSGLVCESGALALTATISVAVLTGLAVTTSHSNSILTLVPLVSRTGSPSVYPPFGRVRE